MSTKNRWLNLGKKTAPEIPYESPIWLGNRSNGEYYHPQTQREAGMRAEILRRGDVQARRLGMDRREFMASSMGMAVALTVMNEAACSKSNGESAGPGCTSDAGAAFPPQSTPYVVPPQATCESSALLDASSTFIFDVQTHCFDDGPWRTQNTVYPTFLNALAGFSKTCTAANPLDCYDPDNYAELMFVDSDTTMTVITSWPAAMCLPQRQVLGNAPVACGLPLSNEGMRNLRDWINTRAMSQRCINQVQVMPNDFLEYQIEGMYAAMQDPSWKCGSWKAYPAWVSDTYPGDAGPARAYFLTDPIGIAFIEAGLKLGVPNFAIHKGLPIPGFDVIHNEPTDIGPIAKMFPQANFVIYHSAINAGTGGTTASALLPVNTETVPYAQTGPVTGVNMLIRSLIESGVIQDPDVTKQPVQPCNVYAEMGSAWSQVMNDPNSSAQHYIGKLLKYLGPDNICWGTDCVLSGSPQSQIAAFKAFSILPQFTEMYGYPALAVDDPIKAKIFGLNAARLYHVDPTLARCQVNENTFTMRKRLLDNELGPNRWAVKPPLGPRNVQEYLMHAKHMRAKGVPG
jgi:predicted TIM-barrel fold metal-dependent hydrolase